MAKDRLQLHEELCDILGSRNVYFQPPESVKIKYPAIIYHVENIDQKFANNMTYNKDRAYLLILVHPDPDNEIIEKLLFSFPKIRFDRAYDSDNIHHYVYVLYE